MSGMYVDSDELLDVIRTVERHEEKTSDRIDRLEFALAAIKRTPTPPNATTTNVYARRVDHEKLHEVVDEMLDLLKWQNQVIAELCLALDLTPDDFPNVRNLRT